MCSQAELGNKGVKVVSPATRFFDISGQIEFNDYSGRADFVDNGDVGFRFLHGIAPCLRGPDDIIAAYLSAC